MSPSNTCPQCGSRIPPDSPSGACPVCLLGLGAPDAADRDRTAPLTARFSPPKPSQLAPHFPQLEILDLLGQGGMGAVYKARQRGLERFVALKILPPASANDPAFAERFAREARTLAQLNHPNIVGVHDFGQAGGLYYLVMEYVDGITLRQAIDTGELTAKEALAIVPQICEALQFAHDEGVVHRDIKPENVLLDRRGRVKIADFGLAKMLAPSREDYTLTASHQVMGTPRYMAPEQMEGAHEVDHRADIYSLGVVFYEMLTRELPLGRFAPPSRKVQVDVRLDDVVLRTLEKEPARRYQKASDVKTDVEAISGATPIRQMLPRLYGYEYRSRRQIFGLPLVHIARGFDPATGRKRVAKGVIAIGDAAIGGLFAMGGVALGPVAIGGVAIGLFTLAGASIGLLMAIGGAAVGLGLSAGGGAIGSIAVGGGAVGWYAYGGGALGFHTYSSISRDPAALGLWTERFGLLPAGVSIVLALLSPLLVILLLLLLAAVTARPPRQETPPQKNVDPYGVKPSGRNSSVVAVIGCGIMLFLLVAFIFLCGLATFFFSYSSLRVEHVTQPATKPQLIENEQPPSARLWHLTDEGPVLDAALEDRLRLSDEQRESVGKTLRTFADEYLLMEKKFVERQYTEAGHAIAVLKPFPNEFARFENRFWTAMDSVLSPDQQAMARRILPVRPQERGPFNTAVGITNPGIFGWAGEPCQIEIWQEGRWFKWSVRNKNGNFASGGSELPPQFRRFRSDGKSGKP